MYLLCDISHGWLIASSACGCACSMLWKIVWNEGWCLSVSVCLILFDSTFQFISNVHNTA